MMRPTIQCTQQETMLVREPNRVSSGLSHVGRVSFLLLPRGRVSGTLLLGSRGSVTGGHSVHTLAEGCAEY
jgi:hypothetical protein